MRMKYKTREEWLMAGVALCNKIFMDVGHTVPKNIRVSCGLPSKGAFAKKQRIGECWSDSCSRGKMFEIFISPVLDDPCRVLDVLIHEIVHAIVGLKCGHRGQFKKVAVDVGLEGPMRSTHAGPVLKDRLNSLNKTLGVYPHQQLTKFNSSEKTQSTRLIKITCNECGYICRTTQKWLNVGTPTCHCGGEFKSS